MTTEDNLLIVGVVGPCGSGKTTLISTLRRMGIPCQLHHIAQEHSFVPNMWLRLVHPDVLIFLDVSFSVSMARRKLDWTIDDYLEQHRRLSHARQHANLYISTDDLAPDEVVNMVILFINSFSPGIDLT